MNRRRSHDRENGSISVELAILTPVLILLLGALVLVGRVETTTSAIEQAARSAARDASLARTPDGARAAAQAAASRELATTSCITTSVAVDASGFSARIGQDAVVTTTVSCTVTLADLAVPGLPGARTVTAQATSTLDRYRTR